jgi:hypothetical protein
MFDDVSQPSWSYGGIEVYITEDARRLHLFALVVGLIAIVAAPMTAAGWALVRFWPMSGIAWVLTAIALWTLAIATAVDEEDL